MTHPLFEEDAWCYWLVSVGAFLSFVGFIVVCICSCRRKENKSEFLGLPGMVTLNHSENEGLNRIPIVDVSQIVNQDVIDNGKRTSSANRSLPDIPRDKSNGNESRGESGLQDIYETTETNSDLHSELYATVCDKDISNMERSSQDNSQQNTSMQNSEYQYACFALPNSTNTNNDEHPYAQLQNIQKTEVNLVKNRTSANPTTSAEVSTSQINNPVAPPRTRRSSSHNSLTVQESSNNIQAANAISGGVQANQDLPYMTPPLLLPLPNPPQSPHNNPQHFSGDSQDSKGYTSISVREPLANIMAQTKASFQHQATRPSVDPHYATVSDDSDEMYAAIDEQDKVYTSGSETYAQIQPTTTELTRPIQEDQVAVSVPAMRSEEPHSAPQPPSVDSLRYVAHAHSRQASSSSATSSIINTGSPKPEKRQANSPLPPPPETITEIYASVDKRPKSEERSRSSMSTGKSLEDMYAKVMKKKRDMEEQSIDVNFSSPSYSDSTSLRKLSLIEVSRASWSSHDSVEIHKKETEVHQNISSSNQNDIDSACPKSPKSIDMDINFTYPTTHHGYEAVSKAIDNKPNVGSTDPNYEVLHPQLSQTNDYAMNVTRNGIDPAATYSVPFKHRQISNASSEDPGYERVRLRRAMDVDPDTDSEPNYESMPHESCEPNYASVCRLGDSDTDPNYESVGGHSDPNYESVKYACVTGTSHNEEPPYEQVNNYKSRPNINDKLKGDQVDPDYEKITLNQQNSNGDTDDEQYIQV